MVPLGAPLSYCPRSIITACVLWSPLRESLVHFPYVAVQVTREGAEDGEVRVTYCVGPLFSEAIY